MSKKQSTYRLLSSFLMILTTSLLVVQVAFAVFNADNHKVNEDKEETITAATQTEALLPVVVLPFCKAVFTSFLVVALLLPFFSEVVKKSQEFYLIFNVQILGSICMNGP